MLSAWKGFPSMVWAISIYSRSLWVCVPCWPVWVRPWETVWRCGERCNVKKSCSIANTVFRRPSPASLPINTWNDSKKRIITKTSIIWRFWLRPTIWIRVSRKQKSRYRSWCALWSHTNHICSRRIKTKTACLFLRYTVSLVAWLTAHTKKFRCLRWTHIRPLPAVIFILVRTCAKSVRKTVHANSHRCSTWRTLDWVSLKSSLQFYGCPVNSLSRKVLSLSIRMKCKVKSVNNSTIWLQ